MPLPPPVIKIVLLVSFIIKRLPPWLTSAMFRSCFREFSPANRRNRCPLGSEPKRCEPSLDTQVCRARTAEGFGERSRIAHVGRERLPRLGAQNGAVAPGRAPQRVPSYPSIA